MAADHTTAKLDLAGQPGTEILQFQAISGDL